MENYKEDRPWGAYEILKQLEVVGENLRDTCIKILTVKPGKRLSYQSHKLRNEHWFVFQGQGAVVINGTEIILQVGSSVDIPIGVKHRAINTHSTLDLLIAEIQTGHYDEEDIQRFEDDFGRV